MDYMLHFDPHGMAPTSTHVEKIMIGFDIISNDLKRLFDSIAAQVFHFIVLIHTLRILVFTMIIVSFMCGQVIWYV